MLLAFCSSLRGQNQYLSFRTNSALELRIIDSIGYQKVHSNLKLLQTEVETLQTKLYDIGYINSIISQQIKLNDSISQFEIQLREQIRFVEIAINEETATLAAELLNLKIGSQFVKFTEVEKYLNNIVSQLENNGYNQAKCTLNEISQRTNYLQATLNIVIGTKRQINDIVIIGYDKFPKGIKNNIARNYKNKNFSIENLQKIKRDFNALNFISQPKSPEILFTKDTTKVYVYLQKNKANRFDGLIGFGNGENNEVRFNGYLDLLLTNTIDAGETFILNWKNDGNRQTNFNIGLEIPAFLKTRLILKSHLQIFKQDSLFQNTKFTADVGYLLKQNLKLFAGIQSTESTNIEATNPQIADLATQFVKLQGNYEKLYERDNAYFNLYQKKASIDINAGIGTRKTTNTNQNQQFATIETLHNIGITEKLSFNIRTHSNILISDSFFTNELHRFGGINSIRGFNENSLQSNTKVLILSEFRLALSPSLYVHTVTDYGFYEDKTIASKADLIGFGGGFGVLTKNGLLQFIYAIGRQNDAGNTIVHISFKVAF